MRNKGTSHHQFKIVNVVTSANIRPINIELVAMRLSRTLYEPELFPGVIYRPVVPKCTVILFQTGRIVSTGISDIRKFDCGILSAVDEISKVMGKKYEARSTKIVNTTAVLDLGQKIDQIQTVKILDGANYDVKRFPGIVYRVSLDESNACFLIFSSGKIVITGAKSKQTLETLKRHIIKQIIK